MREVDIIGKRFDRLVVTSFHSTIKHKRHYLCVCDCGCEKVILGACLTRGTTKSCGCLHRDIARLSENKRSTHGHSRVGKYSGAFVSWGSMKTRCLNKNHRFFDRYGGRGITICPEWIDSFEAFLRDMGDRPDGLTLERINNDSGYSKDNCIWATRKQQANNRDNARDRRVKVVG